MITNESLRIEEIPPITTITTPAIATTTTIKITTTITSVTMITTNSKIEGKKLSELMLPPQLRTKEPGAFTRRYTGSHYPKTYWESLPKDILGVITQKHTGSQYPKTYWESLPEVILEALPGDRSHYPKTYWESLPEDILGVITRRHTRSEAIPLDLVDIFWRTLDVSWSTPLEHEDIQCDDELHIFEETFNKQSNAGKKSLLRRLDVRGDENCGFRSVAVALGLSEDQWPRIRSDIVRELEANHQNYKYIFGMTGYKQLYKTVRFAGKLMEMPNTGLIIASAYNRVVISLANGGNVGGCTTTFSLWSSPPQSEPHGTIVIAHVYGNHFIKAALCEVALYR
nr:hypothetical protein [Tanacetum cinerariifolium]